MNGLWMNDSRWGECLWTLAGVIACGSRWRDRFGLSLGRLLVDLAVVSPNTPGVIALDSRRCDRW
jgi:hypothetical protein